MGWYIVCLQEYAFTELHAFFINPFIIHKDKYDTHLTVLENTTEHTPCKYSRTPIKIWLSDQALCTLKQRNSEIVCGQNQTEN